MAAITGTILAAKISPGDTSATFPTHEDIYGKGGLISVTNFDELTSIPLDRQKVGMAVHVNSDSQYYTISSLSYPLTSYSVFFTKSLFVSGGNSSQWNSVYSYTNTNSSFDQAARSLVNSNSSNWNNAYNTGIVYQNVSGSYAINNTIVGYINNNFLPLTGGLISGPVRINNNLTIFGNLTATGNTTFANTIFSTTSAVSVYHVGSGPAMWVGNSGNGDIASFYDIDQNIEVLHVGGNSGSFPNVGVKTSTPNKDFTVNGEISANNIIYDNAGNSRQWNSVYSYTNTNSSFDQAVRSFVNQNSAEILNSYNATSWVFANTAREIAVSTVVNNTSANWNSVFTNVVANSASWEESAEIIPTVTNYLSTNDILIKNLFIGNIINPITGNRIVVNNGNIRVNGIDLSNVPNITAFDTDGQSLFDLRSASASANYNLSIASSGVGHFLKFFGGRETDPNPFIVVKTGEPLRFASYSNFYNTGNDFKEHMRIDTQTGNIGINTTQTTQKLTVSGNIFVSNSLSANNVIYAFGGNSNLWNSVYTNVQNNSASWEESADITAITTAVASNSGNWNNAYNTATIYQSASGSLLNLISTIFVQLTSLKANNQLVAGQYYRISDFQLMWWNQSINDTTVKFGLSAEPLIVLALSGNRISHEAKSELYPQDTVYYDIDATSSNSWGTINNNTPIPNFKGWIYRRIDHKLNIDIPWDWRHITVNCCRPDMSSISLYSSLSTYNLYSVVKNASNKLYYSVKDSNTNNSLTNIDWWLPVSDFVEGDTYFSTNESFGFRAYNKNGIFVNLPANTGTRIQQPTFTSSLVSQGTFSLTNCNNIKIEGGYSNIILGNNFISNTIGNNFFSNTIGNGFFYNTIGNFFDSNTIGNNFFSNTIGNFFDSNTIGNNFFSNTIGNNFFSNTIGNFFDSNTIGNNFLSNTIGNNFNTNTIGNNFNTNTIGNSFRMNTSEDNLTIGNVTSATHVYNLYNTRLFKNSNQTVRLSYFNSSDQLVVTDPTA